MKAPTEILQILVADAVPFEPVGVSARQTHASRRDKNSALGNIFITPGKSQTITESAHLLFGKMAKDYYLRGGRVVSFNGENLEIITPEALRSIPERYFKVMSYRVGRGGQIALADDNLSRESASAILASVEKRELPEVRSVSRCPVITSNGRVLGPGFDTASGTLVTGGALPFEINVNEALTVLHKLLSDFNFVSPGDYSRALAGLITPALRMGGLLPLCPMEVVEADMSQGGKGYLCKLTAAIYDDRIRPVAQRDGGVGSFDESIACRLEEGRGFICLDNLKGRVDSAYLECMLTSDRYFGVRIPHKGEMLVDPTRIVLLATSNAMESTPDLANRSYVVRIRKQPHGYEFAEFPEGDLLDHVCANQSLYLGAVFAVVKAWISMGSPKSNVADHDFREWARSLDYIVTRICGAAPLLEGHTEAKQRLSDPSVSFVRQIAMVITHTGGEGRDYSATELHEIAEANSIAIPGLRDYDERQGPRKVGMVFKRVLNGQNEMQIDGLAIHSGSRTFWRTDGRGMRELTTYRFAPLIPTELTFSQKNVQFSEEFYGQRDSEGKLDSENEDPSPAREEFEPEELPW